MTHCEPRSENPSMTTPGLQEPLGDPSMFFTQSASEEDIAEALLGDDVPEYDLDSRMENILNKKMKAAKRRPFQGESHAEPTPDRPGHENAVKVADKVQEA